ncbi:hypothetical protein BH10PSE12_BH10PSE12_37230 [soil metagenome]
MADYIVLTLERESAKAISARLAHVTDYIAHLGHLALRCEQVNEEWIRRFRTWLAKKPVISTAGKIRREPRAPSTIENSVIQLAAAINAAHARGDTTRPAQFRPIQTKELNRTPRRRLTVEQLAEAFRYAIDPQFSVKRANLQRFLIASVSTLGRPDAIYDLSTDPARKQWDGNLQIIHLNPNGRRQTKKYRAIVRAPWQLALQLDQASGFYVGVGSVRSAFDAMCEELGWAKNGEHGTKLIRRSVAQLLRDPARGVPTEQLELQLGHRRIDSVTELYGAFDPAYLREVTAAIESLIDEVEVLVPGAFHRKHTGPSNRIIVNTGHPEGQLTHRKGP